MANQIYGYNPSYNGAAAAAAAAAAALYHSRTVTEPYLDSSSSSSSYMTNSRYLTTDGLSGTDSSYYAGMDGGYQNDGYGYPGSDITGHMKVPSSTAHWSGVDVGASFDPVVMAGVKRSHEALYHQSYLGTNNTFGQSEALFSANSLGKRPRFESAITVPIYPRRPGEKDCSHYMFTRTCKFGDSCKFDHPFWVPEGGLPDWKEVPLIATSEALPERPGAPDCPYFLKTQKCKFGFRCKFNHPKDKTEFLAVSGTVDVSILPERPSEPLCSFYMKTGKCKFGGTCKFHHPKDIQVPVAVQENGYEEQLESVALDDGKTIAGDARPGKPFVPFTPALLHNSKGLPVRPGEVDCPFYLKTGSCKYGATCRYNHPDRNDFCAAINPAVAANYIMTSPVANMNIGVVNPAASILPTIDPRLAQTALGLGSTIYPQRPGQIECDFYMKTGECKFGERCKFHHPMDRATSTPSTTVQVLQQNVKLTLAGLPRREGSIICPFYMRTGTCKYGVTCRFDHPPPGEAIAMATVQGTSSSVGGDGEDKGTEAIQEQQHQQQL